MRQKQIIFALWQDKPGGIEILLPDIIKSLPNYIFSAFIFRKNIRGNSVFANLPMNIQYGSSNNLLLYLRFFYFAVRNRYKTFHVFNIGPIMLLILRIAKVQKVIYSIHGTIYWRTKIQKFFLKIVWHLAINKNLVFTANSSWSKKIFRNQISNKTNIKVIYNPINTTRFTCNIKKTAPPYKIIYTGRLVAGKNLFQWLNCAKKILSVFPKTSFAIYGEGPLTQSLETHTRLLGIANHVIFHGFKRDIENAYKKADLLLFLSEYESFGNVVVESILCGTPVVASDIPSIKEIFQNFPEFIVPLDDKLEDHLIKKINLLFQLKTSAIKAAEEFQSRFSLTQHIQQLENIYRPV